LINLIFIYDHNSNVGVSIPVDSMHYKQLKIISDRVGFGLKRTVEYLITYYWKAEISKEPILEVKPPKDLEPRNGLKEDERNVLASSKESVSGYQISSELPSFLAHRIIQHLPEPKDVESTTTRSPWISDSVSKDQISGLSLSESKNGQNCSVCGVPSNNTAKYCYNCWNKLQ
jgi:hypothetical protein